MAWDGYNVLLYGGHSLNFCHSDTWYWTGNSWYELKPSRNPGKRWMHGMVGLPGHKKVLLFGGNGRHAWEATNDTWTWNGWTKKWTLESTPHGSPPACNEMALAFDGRYVLLFGGYRQKQNNWPWPPSTTYFGDLWEYYPGSGKWKICTQSNERPSKRYGSAMAYYPERGYVVLFGGYAESGAWQNDTWLLDRNHYWIRVYPKTVPPTRSRHQMVYDPSRKKIVMTGGHTTGGGYRNDTWEWDGQDWTEVNVPAAPSPRQAARAAYDPRRKGVTLFGGYYGYNRVANDTWELYTKDPASTWTYGTGGKGSHNKVPALSARTQPVLGKALEFGLTDALPHSWTLLALGTRKANLDLGPSGAPGCTLYPLPSMLFTYLANATGSWTYPPAFAVPAVPALAGFELHFQAGVFDPMANKLGMVTSNALGARIGY